MKLTFRIEYRTAWGEELGVILDGNNSEPIILRTPNGEHWEGEAEMPDLPACVPVSYRYGVYRDGQCIRRESGTMAHLFCPCLLYTSGRIPICFPLHLSFHFSDEALAL